MIKPIVFVPLVILSFATGGLVMRIAKAPPTKVWIHHDWVWVSRDNPDIAIGSIDIDRLTPTSSVVKIIVMKP